MTYQTNDYNNLITNKTLQAQFLITPSGSMLIRVLKRGGSRVGNVITISRRLIPAYSLHPSSQDQRPRPQETTPQSTLPFSSSGTGTTTVNKDPSLREEDCQVV
jgi:hypothetical protein